MNVLRSIDPNTTNNLPLHTRLHAPSSKKKTINANFTSATEEKDTEEKELIVTVSTPKKAINANSIEFVPSTSVTEEKELIVTVSTPKKAINANSIEFVPSTSTPTSTSKKKNYHTKQSIVIDKEIYELLDINININDATVETIDNYLPGYNQVEISGDSKTIVNEAYVVLKNQVDILIAKSLTQTIDIPFFCCQGPGACNYFEIELSTGTNIVVDDCLNCLLYPGSTKCLTISSHDKLNVTNAMDAVLIALEESDPSLSSPLGLVQYDFEMMCKYSAQLLSSMKKLRDFEQSYSVILQIQRKSKCTDLVSVSSDHEDLVLLAVETLKSINVGTFINKRNEKYRDLKFRELFYRKRRQHIQIDQELLGSFGRKNQTRNDISTTPETLEQLTLTVPNLEVPVLLENIQEIARGTNVAVEVEEIYYAQTFFGMRNVRLTGPPHLLPIVHGRICSILSQKSYMSQPTSIGGTTTTTSSSSSGDSSW